MREALFMGRLTAQATHEMQNILATIRESSGLMEDLLAMSAEGFTQAERFKKGLAVLAQQVERGMLLSEQLNYCAHAPEGQSAGAEVNEAAAALVGLMHRVSARRKVRVAFVRGRAGLRAGLKPVEVMEVLGAVLEAAIEALEPGSELGLAVDEQGGLAVARLDAPAYAAMSAAPSFAAALALAKSLGVGISAGPGGAGLVLSLPRPAA